MSIVRVLYLAAAAAFAALILWAAGAASFSESFARITADPWGLVTLADLYAGFAVSALVIAMAEERRWVAVLLVAAMMVLGNIVTMAWLAWRLPTLHARLRRSP
ncbi:hypothetical protein [Prosthecomicrobium sp. N25]|uniref:hypothetical protein n=1 Tax=Prosthecomicrobium sp. N25 TaxID=3129254 RepID=UPI0030778943